MDVDPADRKNADGDGAGGDVDESDRVGVSIYFAHQGDTHLCPLCSVNNLLQADAYRYWEPLSRRGTSLGECVRSSAGPGTVQSTGCGTAVPDWSKSLREGEEAEGVAGREVARAGGSMYTRTHRSGPAADSLTPDPATPTPTTKSQFSKRPSKKRIAGTESNFPKEQCGGEKKVNDEDPSYIAARHFVERRTLPGGIPWSNGQNQTNCGTIMRVESGS